MASHVEPFVMRKLPSEPFTETSGRERLGAYLNLGVGFRGYPDFLAGPL